MNWKNYIYYQDEFITLLQGDCREVLEQLPADSIHCCVTSPPYFGLRNYNVDGQIGLEASPQVFIETMSEVFGKVRRVMRRDATCWLNLGDSYAGSNQGAGTAKPSAKQASNRGTNFMMESSHKSKLSKVPGFKPKDLMMIPHRTAIRLQEDGFWVRQDNCWNKLNPMPEPVIDRTTRAHEYIFQLTKSAKYFFDTEAIKEPVAESTIGRGKVDFGGTKGRNYKPDKSDPNFRNGNEQWGRTFDYAVSCATGRNKRSVWNFASRPFPGSHFAVFPPELPEICIKAGTSEKGVCGGKIKKLKIKENLTPEQQERLTNFLEKKGFLRS